MLFNLLLAVLVIYVMATPFFFLKAVKFGMKIVEEPEAASDTTTFHLPKKKKQPKMTAEEERTAKILANIDRYDGTSNGQMEIKYGR